MEGYTLAGEEGTDAYELPFARAAAAYCGRALSEVALFRPGIDWFTAQGQRDRDVFIPHNGAMSIGLERAAAARGARAMLHGDGGDQWLDGSILYYQEFVRDADLRGFAAALGRDAAAIGWRAAFPRALRSGLGHFVPAALRRRVNLARVHNRYVDPAHLFWIQPEWRERLHEMELAYSAARPVNPMQGSQWGRLFSPYRALALDMMQRQRGHNGIETREPMQTRQFIEFACTTPEWIRAQGGQTKVVHRKAMKGVLPEAILTRTSKAEFSAPDVTVSFARFAADHAAGPLAQVCEPDGLRGLAAAEGNMRVDPELGWEVWGCCAIAAFLDHAPEA
jgi:asparagine synthase (glutamine-hydrolysing)